jgi:hypothetical protein
MIIKPSVEASGIYPLVPTDTRVQIAHSVLESPATLRLDPSVYGQTVEACWEMHDVAKQVGASLSPGQMPLALSQCSMPQQVLSCQLLNIWLSTATDSVRHLPAAM